MDREVIRKKLVKRDWRKYHPESLRERLQAGRELPVDCNPNTLMRSS